ncbi:DUF1552 domain-containing protein [Verrucomicrobia bacterium]|nr:DUF1552 domain-containing protein [Verrucomicrobiales bacterium]MDC0048463.1 DUF1552 domain-containing protein [Verrucomicrobiota bacterium]NCG26727.1 DUF1552 domain-containing protein [Verrucomicrobiales bacterium]|tara:strand:+ start:6189 stop:7415 length:1227 start_codon:yes stop_codon:yes gene_type:complete
MRNISRKEFLKVGAALPLAMNSLSLSAKGKEKSSPRRIIFINNSLGFYAPYFFPKKREDLSTSDYLKGMKTKEKMTVFQNFFHPGMETSNHDSEKSFLTGTPNPESSNFVNGTSLDQLLAKEMGKDTRFPFLNFSIYDRGWGCSWNDRGSAIPPMHDEEKIFEMLFEEEDLRSKKQQLENDQNILNCLRRDLQQLRNQGSDPGKLDNYKALIGEFESRLHHEKFWLEAKKPKVEKSLSEDKQFEFSTKVRNLFELAKLAFQTDSTRVITFSMDWIYGAIKVPGATGGWHTLSHHGGRKNVIAQLSQIEIDTLKHFNNFLFELEQIKEGNGTLLDHTTVVMGSNFGDSSNHTCNNLPMIVAGGGYQHEAHKVMQKPTPLCNLYLELLHKHNMDIGNFGSSERDMDLLKG